MVEVQDRSHPTPVVTEPMTGGQALVSARRRYSIGDPIRATIAATHEELGRVDLVPAAEPSAPR